MRNSRRLLGERDIRKTGAPRQDPHTPSNYVSTPLLPKELASLVPYKARGGGDLAWGGLRWWWEKAGRGTDGGVVAQGHWKLQGPRCLDGSPHWATSSPAVTGVPGPARSAVQIFTERHRGEATEAGSGEPHRRRYPLPTRQNHGSPSPGKFTEALNSRQPSSHRLSTEHSQRHSVDSWLLSRHRGM